MLSNKLDCLVRFQHVVGVPRISVDFAAPIALGQIMGKAPVGILTGGRLGIRKSEMEG